MRLSVFRALAPGISLLATPLSGGGALAAPVAQAPAVAISEHRIQVGEQQVRYLRAGSRGTPIVLVHGWPQSADGWREVMTLLAVEHIVIAPDLRGIGGTSAPTQDWRKETLARDLYAFLQAMNLQKPVLAGHDIGGMVAYACARLFPNTLSGVAILDVPLPGIDPWDAVAGSAHAWHFDFHAQKPLAERLVSGRQAAYFRYFIGSVAKRPAAISDDAVRMYAAAYGSPESLSAGFELYRAFPADAAFIVADSGHWLAEEQPRATADALSRFAGEVALR